MKTILKLSLGLVALAWGPALYAGGRTVVETVCLQAHPERPFTVRNYEWPGLGAYLVTTRKASLAVCETPLSEGGYYFQRPNRSLHQVSPVAARYYSQRPYYVRLNPD